MTNDAPMSRESLLDALLANNDQDCPTCGYNLRGAESHRCPECGTNLILTVGMSPASALRPVALWVAVVVAAKCALTALAIAFTYGQLTMVLVIAGIAASALGLLVWGLISRNPSRALLDSSIAKAVLYLCLVDGLATILVLLGVTR